MKRIPLSKGYYALVDDEDFEWLSQYHWHYAHGYAMRNQRVSEVKPGQTKKKIFMHLEIFSPGVAAIADHKDGDKLNNQKYNFRPSTKQLNQANALSQRGRSSRFKGVCWHKRYERWEAGITVRGRYKFLGRFDSEVQAATAYDAAALEHFGEHARINFAGVVQ